MEDRSLEDFLDAGAGDDDGEGTDGDGSGDEDSRVDPATVEPAATTYAVGEGACAACGASARVRWRGEAGLVCPDCKEW